MSSRNHTETLSLDAEGRLSLPASIRQELGLTEGDQFILTISETGALQLMRLKQKVHSLRGILTNPTPDQGIVDELIQDRRRSAAYE
jgi:bifunctional DNA-binding transcriptional regulator/antitoxin component of YhaV-PrlF toxin-antitoxin module